MAAFEPRLEVAVAELVEMASEIQGLRARLVDVTLRLDRLEVGRDEHGTAEALEAGAVSLAETDEHFMGYADLPVEILEVIFSFLPRGARGVATRVCRWWSSVFDGEQRNMRMILEYVHSAADLCEWARTVGWSWAAVARGGHLDTLRWGQAEGHSWNEKACTHAARGGHLEVFVWAHDHGSNVSIPETMPAAAAGGRMDILEWMWQWKERHPHFAVGWDAPQPCMMAAAFGRLEVLQWLKSKGFMWHDLVSTYAAQNGHLAVLQWALDNGCPHNLSMFHGALQHSQLLVLEWMRADGRSWQEDGVCSAAAFHGKLDVLAWARSKGCPLDEATFAHALLGAHIDVLEWLQDHSCPCDERTYVLGKHDRPDVLEWLHDHGYPWDASTCELALEYMRPDVLRWLHNKGCPWDKWEYILPRL